MQSGEVRIAMYFCDGARLRQVKLSSCAEDVWKDSLKRRGGAEKAFHDIEDAVETLRCYGIDVPLDSVEAETDDGRKTLFRAHDGSLRVTHEC